MPTNSTLPTPRGYIYYFIVWQHEGESAVTIVATIVALVGATIAILQWWVARHKLSVDLFDERFKVYTDLRDYSIKARETKTAELLDFNPILLRARFLFGDDIVAQLGVIHNFTCGIKGGTFPRGGEQIYETFESMEPLFKRYMTMTYALPNSWFEFPRHRPKGMLWRVK
jgi:hypothetical protein